MDLPRLRFPVLLGLQTHTVPAQSIVHIRLQVDPARPWRGVAPLTKLLSLAGKLAASTVSALADEAGMAVGGLLIRCPVPMVKTNLSISCA